MRLTFRQGIARYQTDVYASPSFLQRSGEYVDLIVSPDPTVVVFAHKSATYVVEESKTVARAWGPFSGSAARHLYWDINILDGSLSRGFTTSTPIYSASEPKSPRDDQHWYDKANSVMKVWVGGRWVERIRVFAAVYTANVQPMPLGTQAGETGSFEGGNLVRDPYNKPLRQSDGTFVTTATNLSVVNASTNTVSLEAEVVSAMAKENIPKFSFVQIDRDRRLKLARSDDWRSRVIGLVSEDLYISEVGNVETSGIIQNEQWHWPEDSAGRPVFCGLTGEITLVPPQHGVLQPCGYVFDRTSIFVDPRPVTILDDVRNKVADLPVGPVGTAPVADFTLSASSGPAPLTVQVKSTSLHAPTRWSWDFGDGSEKSTKPEASRTFGEPGTYAVKLTATNDFGSTTKTVSVAVAPANRGVNTNLSIQLGGPLQIAVDQTFPVQVSVSNMALLGATGVVRLITIDDVNDRRVELTNVPANSVVTHIGSATVVSLPKLETLAPSQTVTAAFSIRAPKSPGVINLRAGIASPEKDSSLSDNITSLSIRVK